MVRVFENHIVNSRKKLSKDKIIMLMALRKAFPLFTPEELLKKTIKIMNTGS